MKNTHHHFLIALAIAVTLFVASLYFYMSYSLGGMASGVVDMRNKVAVMRSENTTNEKLKQLDTDSQDDWKKLYTMFVPADNVVPFIVALESLGTNVGSEVSVASIDSSAPESGSLAKNGFINAKVSVRGAWSSVLKTLMLAENMPYKVYLSNVRVSLVSDVASKDAAEWALSFDVSAIKTI